MRQHIARTSRILVIVAWTSSLTVGAVRYSVVFDASWNAGEFPDAFPSGAHFSPPVGGAHNANVTFWEAGGLASVGIERMAEIGATSNLISEINAAIAAGDAATTVVGSTLSNLPRQATLEIELTPEHSLVTLVSMIAPSPDWFVGVSGLPLRDNDSWIGQRSVQLFAYDAGTEDGGGFSTSNLATNPREPISRIQGAPFDGLPPLGTFTFTALPTALSGDFNLDSQVNALDASIWHEGYGGFPTGGAFVVDGDANSNGRVLGDDFLYWQRDQGTALANVAGVPEPAALPLALLALGIRLLLAHRKIPRQTEGA